MVTKGSDGGKKGSKKGSKQKAIDNSYHAPPGNTIVMDIPPPPPPPPGLEPPAALDGFSEEVHHGSNTIVFVQCSAASTLSIDNIYCAPPGNTIIMDIPLPPPPGLEPALQQDSTSCSDNVSTALCEELLGTEGAPVPPYKTAIEEDVSILGNNKFSPLQFESCSIATDDEINDEPHTMVECNNKATVTDVTALPKPRGCRKKTVALPGDTIQSTKPRGKRQSWKSSTVTAMEDNFLGQIAAFFSCSLAGEVIKNSFGNKWTNDALCFTLDATHGHIVGKVMRQSRW